MFIAALLSEFVVLLIMYEQLWLPTIIIGIGTEMAIFYVSENIEFAQHMPPHEALAQASRATALRANKVPEATLVLWIIKILATTVGETGADYLAVQRWAGPTDRHVLEQPDAGHLVMQDPERVVVVRLPLARVERAASTNASNFGSSISPAPGHRSSGQSGR